MFHCPSCSYSALMPTPMLYHDEDKRLMISFSPCDDVVLKSQLFDNVQKSSKESGELDKLEGYNLRFVTDYNELLEKILIFDNDMNDKTMEAVSYTHLDVYKRQERYSAVCAVWDLRHFWDWTISEKTLSQLVCTHICCRRNIRMRKLRFRVRV